VDTTGSSAGYDAQPGTTTPEDWTQHSLVQVEGGFIAGLALGRVPFGSVVAGAIAGPGSRWAEIGRGVGEIVGGGFTFAAGMAGMLGGGAASGTGVLTLPGILAVAGSATLVAGGIANVMTGAERLGQALSMSSGSGSSGPQGTAPAGSRTSRVWPKHHPFPKYLGGAPDQTLKKIPKSMHHQFHAALDKWKGGKYARNLGAEHFKNIDQATVIRDLREFYQTAENGAFSRYLGDFEQAVAETLAR
jgi:hypothetical protein